MFPPPSVAPRPHPRVVETEVDGSTVLMHLDDRRLHFLNRSASAIWDVLGDSATIGDMTLRLAARFEAEPALVRPDVERLLDRLRVDGLVTVSDRVALVDAGPPDSPATADPGRAPDEAAFGAIEAVVRIECDDPEVDALIRELLAPLRTSAAPTVSISVDVDAGGRSRVAAGLEDPVVVGSRLAAVLRVVSKVNDLAVASVPDHLVLHAGAVGSEQGTILLPAASNNGKSTLTAALVEAGFPYLTDEAAALDADLTCRAFSKSITLDPGSFPLFPDLRPTPSDGLGRAVATREWHVDPWRVGTVGGPDRVHAVVCPQWRPGAETRLCRMDGPEALRLLLGEAFDFAAGGQVVFGILGRLVREVPVYRLGYSRLDSAVAVIESIAEDADHLFGAA